MTTELEIQSPCVGVCSMDDLTGYCLGCYRTLEEIQQWWDMDTAAKATVVKTAAEREAAAFG